MVILVMYDHFHSIKSLWSIIFQQLIKNVLNVLLSKQVLLYDNRKPACATSLAKPVTTRWIPVVSRSQTLYLKK